MRLFFIFLLITLSYVNVRATHLVVGNVADRVVLANQTKIEYIGFPLIKRIKYFFFSTPNNKLIRGIQALDTLHTKSSVNVTAGGVGTPFVNLRFKSERGTAMAYEIGIYVDQDFN